MADDDLIEPIKTVYKKDSPEHLQSWENNMWFASFKLEAIQQEGDKVIITTWRRGKQDRIVENTIEMGEDETVTWTDMKLIDSGRLDYLEQCAIENLELRRRINDLLRVSEASIEEKK